MERTVLFAGGPLHGQTLVTDSTSGVYAMDERPLTLSSYPPADLMAELPQPVFYSLFRFAICGRIVWIGYPGATPDEDLVFEVLTSDDAKAASNVFEPSAHP